MIIENVELPESEECIFRSNHISNYVPLAATLPQDKAQLLDDIDYSIKELKKLKDWDVYNHDKYGSY